MARGPDPDILPALLACARPAPFGSGKDRVSWRIQDELHSEHGNYEVLGPDLLLEPLPRRILKSGKPREVGLQRLLHPFYRGLTQCQPFGPFQ